MVNFCSQICCCKGLQYENAAPEGAQLPLILQQLRVQAGGLRYSASSCAYRRESAGRSRRAAAGCS